MILTMRRRRMVKMMVIITEVMRVNDDKNNAGDGGHGGDYDIGHHLLNNGNLQYTLLSTIYQFILT